MRARAGGVGYLVSLQMSTPVENSTPQVATSAWTNMAKRNLGFCAGGTLCGIFVDTTPR